MWETSTTSSLRANIVRFTRKLAGDERGATAIEYALVAAGIAVAVSAAVFSLGSATADLYAKVSGLF